jgi:hypothetical protein
MSSQNDSTGDRRDFGVFGADNHSCLGKARAIQRRLGIMLGLDAHEVISEMCKAWGVANADEFYQRMNSMTDAQLAADVDAAWDKVKKRKRLMGLTIEQQVAAYQ